MPPMMFQALASPMFTNMKTARRVQYASAIRGKHATSAPASVSHASFCPRMDRGSIGIVILSLALDGTQSEEPLRAQQQKQDQRAEDQGWSDGREVVEREVVRNAVQERAGQHAGNAAQSSDDDDQEGIHGPLEVHVGRKRLRSDQQCPG